jgi:hypothetical protein
MGLIMSTGNRTLGAIQDLLRLVVYKPGGLKKQAQNRLFYGFNLASSDTKTRRALYDIGHGHMDCILDFNRKREAVGGPSHANLSPPWLKVEGIQ